MPVNSSPMTSWSHLKNHQGNQVSYKVQCMRDVLYMFHRTTAHTSGVIFLLLRWSTVTYLGQCVWWLFKLWMFCTNSRPLKRAVSVWSEHRVLTLWSERRSVAVHGIMNYDLVLHQMSLFLRSLITCCLIFLGFSVRGCLISQGLG